MFLQRLAINKQATVVLYHFFTTVLEYISQYSCSFSMDHFMDHFYRHYTCTYADENCRIASFQESCDRNKHIQPVTLGKEGFYIDKKDNLIRCFRCSFSTVIADKQDITKCVIEHHALLTGNKLCIAEINSKSRGWWRKL